MHRAVNDPTVREWLAAVNDGFPSSAVVVRPAIGFDIPKDVGSPLILIVMQDPFYCCCFKLLWFIRKNW